MLDKTTDFRNSFIELIENETDLNDRFVDIQRIDEKAGDGYFSLVFRSYDKITGKSVILKFFDPLKQSDVDRVKRFHREAEMLVKLKDEPFVINCINCGIQIFRKMMQVPDTGQYFPVEMQFIPMERADHNAEFIIINNSPDALELLSLFRNMYKAVSRIHKRSICHRDLKPTNFLFKNNNVYIGDLGAAKYMDGTMPDIRTSYYNPVGDFHYTAPELFFSIGIADEFVFNADIFSLGAILFELFTERVLTQEIYTTTFIKNILMIKQLTDGMSKENRRNLCFEMIEEFSKTMFLPDIFSYNLKVPNSIKFHLNDLYKSLVNIDFTRRLNNPITIYRKLDICIKILNNQDIYNAWLANKRQRSKVRLERVNNRI